MSASTPSYVNLRWGTSAWGYNHLGDRWSKGFERDMVATLFSPDTAIKRIGKGTSYRYTRGGVEHDGNICDFKVIENRARTRYDGKSRGIITATYDNCVGHILF
jgi:hypothetical protein